MTLLYITLRKTSKEVRSKEASTLTELNSPFQNFKGIRPMKDSLEFKKPICENHFFKRSHYFTNNLNILFL